ncbi:hypothetical protein I4U23_018642 [Adineta vaga]|nr:hypothetical protein I4U23_018642 [Adineta vaga]
MILYIEKELLLDTPCRSLNICDNKTNNECLILSSNEQCSCKKQQAILCKSNHDLCQNRCLSENILYIKQHVESNEIFINDCRTNVIILDKNELDTNSEIVYICQKNNLPKVIFEHLSNKLSYIDNSSTDLLLTQTSIGSFLLKNSVLVQSFYGMYLTLQQAKSNSFHLRRRANLGYLFANIFVGILCSYLLYQHFDFNLPVANEISSQTKQLTTWIKSIIEWLMHAPAGLKLNQPLVDFLARFYFYHIYLWSGYLEALLMTVLPYLFQLLIILCFFGISIAIGAICDFVRLLTIHLYCFYIYAARLFNWQISLLISLFRLFCGKKQNPLRNNRLDSHLCDIDQLFIVTLSFTILLFLLPSIFMYYAVFTSIRMNNGTLTLFDRYDVGCELGKGTYGIVRKAFDTRQQHHVAIKCVCLGEEGIPSTALREISLLRSLKHPNIIRLYDIQVHQPTGELFLFYECMEMDLYEYMKLYRKALPDELSKSYLKQMLLGIDYIHSNSMLHRDLKPQNILIDWIGSLKLADFGLGRHFQMPMRMYTHEVVTLWYRSPEILLGAKTYTTSVDLWSIGTIFAEITHNRALFAGECEIDQLFRIFRTLGTPDDIIWPGFSSMPDHKKTFPQWKSQDMSQLLSNLSPDALQLTLQMLIYDPDRRITAKAALDSPYIQSIPSHLIIPPAIKSPSSSTNQSNS